MPPFRVRLGVFALFLLIFPFFLRRRPRVERRATICAPPHAIFPLINDLRNWPLWTAWVEADDIELSYGEVIEGVGAMQRWHSAQKEGVLRIVRSELHRRIDYTLQMGRGKHQLFGRIDFVPDGACTRITWKCVWEPARNPYLRYRDLFFRWMIGRDFAIGLGKLKALVERSEPAASAQTA